MNPYLQTAGCGLAIVALSALATTAAHAQSKGQWMARGGLLNVTPQVNSGDLSTPSEPHTTIDVSGDTVLAGGVTYMLTDHWSVDVPLALPIRGRIKGDGAIAGTGEIAHTDSYPVTVFMQYRFGPAVSKCRPYLGFGPTYAYFDRTTGNGTLTALTNPGGEPTTLKIDNKLTFTVQAGVSVQFKDRWFYDLSLMWTKLKTRSTLSTGQKIDVTLDPVAVGAYIGYRF